jgi:hypothetical protein
MCFHFSIITRKRQRFKKTSSFAKRHRFAKSFFSSKTHRFVDRLRMLRNTPMAPAGRAGRGGGGRAEPRHLTIIFILLLLLLLFYNFFFCMQLKWTRRNKAPSWQLPKNLSGMIRPHINKVISRKYSPFFTDHIYSSSLQICSRTVYSRLYEIYAFYPLL